MLAKILNVERLKNIENRKTSHFKLLVFIISLSLLTGCTTLFGPDYKRPVSPAKKKWSLKQVNEQAIEQDWWKNFGDPYLDGLIAKTITDNIDIKVLAARIGLAEDTVSQVNAARLPVVDAAFGGNYQKNSGAKFSSSYSWATALSWEIDIWGKLKKGVEGQEAEYKATEADWRAGYLTIVSAVASTYFQIRQLDEQIHQQQGSLEKNQKILNILQALYAEGMLANTVVLQQSAEVNRLHRELLELNRFREITENALATLQGLPAGDYSVSPGRLSDLINLVDVPAGLPSDLLERRPDIIAAEYRVIKAHNFAGQAKRALLPTVSLTAKGGNSSIELTDVLKAFSTGFSPSIDLPFLDPGVHARVDVTEAQAELSKEEYRSAVIKAFEEVENALVNLASHKQQRIELQERLDKLRRVSQQIRAQLEEGIVSQLEVFESERSLLTAELALLQNHRQILADTVGLYKALGGGWPKENFSDAS